MNNVAPLREQIVAKLYSAVLSDALVLLACWQTSRSGAGNRNPLPQGRYHQ